MPNQVPPQTPVVTYESPNKRDRGLIEFWNTEVAEYRPLDIGTPHPNTQEYPGFTLGLQKALQNNEKWVFRIWTSPETNPDWFNYAVKLSEESANFPIYIRTYRELKETFVPTPKGSTLKSLIGLKVVEPGIGYTPGTFPNLTFTGNGTGAAGHAVVNPDGSIAEFVLDDGGVDYTFCSFIVDPPPNIGTIAEGITVLQPAKCVLVKEEANEYPKDSQYYAQYFDVTRVYETLPGPFVCSTKPDEDGVLATVCKRRNRCSDITASETLNGATWTQTSKTGIDDFVCEETVESRDITVAGDNLTPYLGTTRVDEDGMTIKVNRVMASKAYSESITPREVVTGGFWVRITSEAITDLKVWIVTESRPIPGNIMLSSKLDDYGNPVLELRQLVETSSIVPQEEITGGGVWRRTFGEKVSELVSWSITLEIPLPGKQITQTIFDKNGDRHLINRRLKDISTITEGQTLVLTFWTSTTSKPVSELVAEEIIETVTVPGVQVPFSHVDNVYGIVINGYKQLVPATTVGGISGGFYNEVKPLDPLRSILIASQIDADSLPEDKVWYTGKVHNFPPELVMNITGSCPTPSGDPVIDWATATCGCSSTFSANLISNMKQYSGQVTVRVTEQFFIGPPPNDIAITQFFPESHNFGYAWASACGDSDGNCVTKSGAPHFGIPLCLHPEVTFCIGATSWTFAATDPPALPHGDYIMLPPHIEERSFGLFRRVLTEVLVP